MIKADAKGSFFRQSAWMIVASLAGGVAMMLVHTLVSKRAGEAAFAEFRALLSSFYVISAASGGLWPLFGQQTAAAVTPEQKRHVAATARAVFGVICLVWFLLGLLLWWRQEWLTQLWKLSNPASLWATWGLGWATLGASLMRGLVQGRQQFLELGAMGILDGIGRLSVVWIALVVFGGLAAGAMTGALIGAICALGVGAWGARSLLFLPGGQVHWGSWLRGFIPLAASAAALQMFQQYDQIFWQALIPKHQIETWRLGSLYMPAQTIGFALTQFTVPLALVMMPRLSRSAATGEKSDALRLGLLSTSLLSVLAAIACTVLPVLPLQVMFFNNPRNWAASPLVPWFAWSMACFAVANVFLSDLIARRRFAAVWGVALLCLAYVSVLQVLGPRLLEMVPAVAYRTGVQINLGLNISYLLYAAAVSHWTRRGLAVARPATKHDSAPAAHAPVAP